MTVSSNIYHIYSFFCFVVKSFGIFQLSIASGEAGVHGLRAAKPVEVESRVEDV